MMTGKKFYAQNEIEFQLHNRGAVKKIAIVGNPNVGKSVLFNNLTGHYATVSNYPGTTVEVSRGRAYLNGTEYEIIDTPGMYSLLPITEEERVARAILLEESPTLVVNVVSAKNLERMLSLTLQLIEAGFPTILVLNIMDEAQREGVTIDSGSLEKELGIPVVEAVSTAGKGMDELKERLASPHPPLGKGRFFIRYPFETEIEAIGALLTHRYPLSKRGLALLLLEEDGEIKERVRMEEPDVLFQVDELIKKAKLRSVNPLVFEVALERQHKVMEITNKVVVISKGKITFSERLSHLLMNPITGFPILFLVLYFGLYKFVGGLGAGVVVDFLEGTVFGRYLNPFITHIVTQVVPYKVVQDLFVGEYGVLTLGVRYAVALILPLVTFFFLVFSLLEDTGYLPRLAMLLDRTFKKIGLSGRAVIPMVLGFGCDTMATVVTRTLPTRRERVIATMLLALAVPCSAQMGVILALLAGRPKAPLIWAGVVVLVFLFIGFLTAKILPGERPSFYMEIPPLRWPKVSNVLTKTYVRVKWYFKEVLPLFLLASVIIWLGQLTRLFNLLVNLLRRPVELIGLPSDAARVFLFGFFRRDYGAAGLYDLNKQVGLSGIQLVTACVALTLFLPCIAQFLMNVKERGFKTGLGISVFVLFFSFGVAFILNFILTRLGVVV